MMAYPMSITRRLRMDSVPTFFKGAHSVLAQVSEWFAEVFGRGTLAEPLHDGVIAAALAQQNHLFPEVFQEAMDSALPEEMVLRRAAAKRGMHLYTLAYGIPAAMAEAFQVTSPKEISLLIRAGEFEPEILAILLAENGQKPLAAGMFRDSGNQDAYALRAQFCAAFLGVDSAYALLQAGILPATDYKDFQKVIDCIILGVDAKYAAGTKGCIDPPEVVKAYREGISLEYLMSTL